MMKVFGDSRIPVEELLPHRPPMVLLDEVESFDLQAKVLTARVTITPKQFFYFTGNDNEAGVPNWVAIEYMAQTSAVLAGCHDKYLSPDAPVRPGLLLGTRRLNLNLRNFELNKTYRVTASTAFWDADAAAFECTIRDEADNVVATATLNAYRPPNLGNFLKEQAKA